VRLASSGGRVLPSRLLPAGASVAPSRACSRDKYRKSNGTSLLFGLKAARRLGAALWMGRAAAHEGSSA
jgi:hypothetical protein